MFMVLLHLLYLLCFLHFLCFLYFLLLRCWQHTELGGLRRVRRPSGGGAEHLARLALPFFFLLILELLEGPSLLVLVLLHCLLFRPALDAQLGSLFLSVLLIVILLVERFLRGLGSSLVGLRHSFPLSLLALLQRMLVVAPMHHVAHTLVDVGHVCLGLVGIDTLFFGFISVLHESLGHSLLILLITLDQSSMHALASRQEVMLSSLLEFHELLVDDIHSLFAGCIALPLGNLLSPLLCLSFQSSTNVYCCGWDEMRFLVLRHLLTSDSLANVGRFVRIVIPPIFHVHVIPVSGCDLDKCRVHLLRSHGQCHGGKDGQDHRRCATVV